MSRQMAQINFVEMVANVLTWCSCLSARHWLRVCEGATCSSFFIRLRCLAVIVVLGEAYSGSTRQADSEVDDSVSESSSPLLTLR